MRKTPIGKIIKRIAALSLGLSFLLITHAPSVYAACNSNGGGGWKVDMGGNYSQLPYLSLGFKPMRRIGGVSLDQAATFLADMSDVKGAYFDQASNRIVFMGTKLNAGQTPVFDKDDLAVAIRSIVFNNTLPQVDIGDPNNPNQQPWPVTFYGGLENTNFGNVIEKADYSLKQYYMGYTPSGQKIYSSVPATAPSLIVSLP